MAATLARWYPDFPFSVRLFDANPERLDLVDLLLRRLMDEWNSEVLVSASQDIGEVMEGATEVILTLHQDCARRMLGEGESASIDYFEELNPLDLYAGGDRNRPTPIDQLSPETRRLLTRPNDQEATRKSAIELASGQVLGLVDPSARVVSLMRGVDVANRELTFLAWPDPLDDLQVAVVPHQILRWVRGDDGVGSLGEAADRSPLLAWLKQGEAS
jgi:hypothetical protein